MSIAETPKRRPASLSPPLPRRLRRIRVLPRWVRGCTGRKRLPGFFFLSSLLLGSLLARMLVSHADHVARSDITAATRTEHERQLDVPSPEAAASRPPPRPPPPSFRSFRSFRSSLRSEADKERAQRCVRARRGAVYVKHHRKAGGSTLYRQLSSTCRGRPRKPPVPLYGSELPYFDPARAFGDALTSSNVVFVTNLRHPVERILSMYWFEGRWPRTCFDDCEDRKVKNDTNKVADLEEWVESVHGQSNVGKLKVRRHTGCGQWQSVENYYIRQMLGVDRGVDGRRFLNVTLAEHHLERAKEVLAAFDLVLIQERYQTDPDMVRMFQTITGGPPGAALPHEKKGTERRRYYRPPPNATLERLERLNRLDIELYEYALQLSDRTVRRWVERQRSADMDAVDGGHGANASSIDGCETQPMELSNEKFDALLGGKGCKGSKIFYYFGGKCLLHSAAE